MIDAGGWVRPSEQGRAVCMFVYLVGGTCEEVRGAVSMSYRALGQEFVCQDAAGKALRVFRAGDVAYALVSPGHLNVWT